MNDWAAVAEAINERVNELGWRQGELAERSHVSRATVRELQHHVVERRRSARTLEALSTTLGWHPRYLEAVLRGRHPPEQDEPVTNKGKVCGPAWMRLNSICATSPSDWTPSKRISQR